MSVRCMAWCLDIARIDVLLGLLFFPTLGVGLLDFKVSCCSLPVETTSWSAQPHKLPSRVASPNSLP